MESNGSIEPQTATTVTVLEPRLKIVRVSKESTKQRMWECTRTLWFRKPNDPFFSITVNDIELSIFAEADLVESVFRPIADVDEGVEIGEEVWCAVSVEQHGDDWESSGNRVKEISAPLAAAGISILFLSTYFADFFLVKARRIAQVCEILQQQSGFVFDSSDHEGPRSKSNTEANRSPVTATGGMTSPARSPSSSVTGSMILTRSASSIVTSPLVSPRRATSRDSQNSPMLRSFSGSSSFDVSETMTTVQEDSPPNLPRSFPNLAKEDSIEPILDPIPLTILPDEIVSVGLATSQEDIWREKLVRAVFFGTEISPRSVRGRSLRRVEQVRVIDQDEDPVKRDVETSNDLGTTPKPEEPPMMLSMRSNSVHPFSTSTATPDRPRGTSSPFVSFTQTLEGASLTADIQLLRRLFADSDENLVLTVGEGGLEGGWIGEDSSCPPTPTSDVSSEDEGEVQPTPRGRTNRPRRERNFSIDDESDWQEVVRGSGSSASRPVDAARRLLKCLQLDLSSFGLDKYGIVHRFADTLTKEDINLLYSSTFRTANILVGKDDLAKARSTLQSLY